MVHSDCIDKKGDTCPSRKLLRLDHSSNWPVRESDKAAGAGHGPSRYAKGGTPNPGGSRKSSVGTAGNVVNAPDHHCRSAIDSSQCGSERSLRQSGKQCNIG